MDFINETPGDESKVSSIIEALQIPYISIEKIDETLAKTANSFRKDTDKQLKIAKTIKCV